MPLKIIRQDITKICCDAIVDPTDKYYSHGGGTDAAIHKAAGAELYHACVEQGWLSCGSAIITGGFALPCSYVIHTVGPVWADGLHGEEEQLRSCYRSCLDLAKAKGCESVAFPLISSGTYGFPKDRVLRIAVDVISRFLFENEMFVYIVVYDKTSYKISEKLFSDVTSFIDDRYAEEKRYAHVYGEITSQRDFLKKRISHSILGDITPIDRDGDRPCAAPRSLDEMLRERDKGFADTLFHYIDKKRISDVECYKRANVDKKTFSKIKCNKNYKPSKVTVVSFAIALRLDLEETNHLLNTVGMSLSRSSTFDIIIEYFITTGNYENIFDVNETLWQFDQVTLGV